MGDNAVPVLADAGAAEDGRDVELEEDAFKEFGDAEYGVHDAGIVYVMFVVRRALSAENIR